MKNKNDEFMDLSKKVIVVVCLVIAVLCGGIIAATLFSEPESIDEVNITNNNTTEADREVVESSDEVKTEKSYGYCAVCGKALSASEANNEYTQGKVCHSCANNPPGGPDYANQKLKEAYPDEYYWLETGYEDSYVE